MILSLLMSSKAKLRKRDSSLLSEEMTRSHSRKIWFHSPYLALKVLEEDKHCLCSYAWLFTLHASKTELNQIFLLWDLVISSDNKLLSLFLSLALLLINKDKIMASSQCELNVVLASLSFHNDLQVKRA
jgi:hypothetical protein